MALYEIDTLAKALKKYVIIGGIGAAAGVGISLYLGSCSKGAQRTDHDEGPARQELFEKYTVPQRRGQASIANLESLTAQYTRQETYRSTRFK